ncbi:MAG: LysR family transcriptional regulator [Suipraeoptans sp.]
MELKLLEYIVTIADEGNITKAADKLFVTQSALNQQLLKLEKELGLTLFIRTHNKCYLTDVGKIYVDSARNMLSLKKDTYCRMYETENIQKGSLSIGLTPGRGINMFAYVYPKFHREHTGISITPYELNVHEQNKLLENGSLDLGFLTLSEVQKKESLKYTVLCREEIYFAVPKRHPVAKNYKKIKGCLPTIDLSLLKEEPFVLTDSSSTIRHLTDKCLQSAGFKPEVLFETLDMKTVCVMVENEMCCGFVPAYYANIHNKNIRYFSLNENPSWNNVVANKRNRYISKAAKDFIALATEYWTESICK